MLCVWKYLDPPSICKICRNRPGLKIGTVLHKFFPIQLAGVWNREGLSSYYQHFLCVGTWIDVSPHIFWYPWRGWCKPDICHFFTPSKFVGPKFYTRKHCKKHPKHLKNTPKTVKFELLCIQPGKVYSWQNCFTQTPSVASVTNMGYALGSQ